MTKRFLVFLIGFVFLGLVVFAQTPEENFQKAGKAELAKRETVLLQEKAEIEKFFNEMANDAVISGKEMKTLRRMVANFDQTQKKFDEELGFYKLETVTTLLSITETGSLIRELLDVYFDIGKNRNDDTFNYADNSGQDIRHFFTQKTGQDIRVEKSKDYGARILLGLVTGFLAAFGFLFILSICDVGDILTCCLVPIAFALVFIAFLFWL